MSKALFREEQRLAAWIFMLVIGSGASVLIFVPFAPRQAATVLWVTSFVAMLPAVLLYLMKLMVEVEPGLIRVRFVPFVNRTIQITELESWEACTYDPLGDYGGWGIRWGLRGLGKNRAYNARGNRGVQLVFKNGDRVLIGSQRPEDLAQAITNASVQ
jgi:hypothetical protein